MLSIILYILFLFPKVSNCVIIFRCHKDVMISCQRAVTALSVNPLVPHQVAIGCSDSTVRTFDRRMLTTRDPGNIPINYHKQRSVYIF